MSFIKAHWTWAVGIVAGLWLLSRMLGSKTTAVGANVTTPTGTSVVYGGTNANDAAVQVAQLSAQTQLAQAQVSGNLAVQQAQIAQLANQDTQAANMHIADVQSAAALQITNSNNAVSLRVTDNQTQLGLAQVNAAAAIAAVQAQYGSQTAIAQAQYSSAAQIAAAQYGAEASIAQTSADLQLGLNYNATQLAAYGIQANVVNNQNAALTQIAQAQINSNTQIQSQYLNNQAQALSNQSQLMNETYSLEASGVFNKGGEGGVNQVAAWGALTNPGSAAAGDAAAAATAAASSSQISGIITSLGGAVSSTIGSITGLKAARAALPA